MVFYCPHSRWSYLQSSGQVPSHRLPAPVAFQLALLPVGQHVRHFRGQRHEHRRAGRRPTAQPRAHQKVAGQQHGHLRVQVYSDKRDRYQITGHQAATGAQPVDRGGPEQRAHCRHAEHGGQQHRADVCGDGGETAVLLQLVRPPPSGYRTLEKPNR